MDESFAFEKLDVYQRALTFAKKIQNITKEIKGYFPWCDQCYRAAMSIVLNLAEGAGRQHANDKKNFYFIARGSAFECVPLIELGFDAKVINTSQRDELRVDLKSICQMLTKLIQSIQKEV